MELLPISHDDAVRTVTLNRPEKRNALNFEMMEALIEAFSTEPSPDERVTIIRAEGLAFCGGLQLSSKGLQNGAEEKYLDIDLTPPSTRHAQRSSTQIQRP